VAVQAVEAFRELHPYNWEAIPMDKIYSAGELEALFREAGFSSVKLYGTVEGDPYDLNAKRLIVVAQK
jgi:hypothetical protein